MSTRKAALIACEQGPQISTSASGCCWKVLIKGEEGTVIELSTSPLPDGESRKIILKGVGEHLVDIDAWSSVRVVKGDPSKTYCTFVAERVKCPMER